jgi:hypothetical protein
MITSSSSAKYVDKRRNKREAQIDEKEEANFWYVQLSLRGHLIEIVCSG